MLSSAKSLDSPMPQLGPGLMQVSPGPAASCMHDAPCWSGREVGDRLQHADTY